MKRFISCFLVCLIAITSFAQLQSPEQFLGYKIGSRYTPHYKIVNYFNYLAKQSPDMVKLEQYGETNEGRPLLLAFISTKENITNLENIRQNNLKLAGFDADKANASEKTPAIIWMSYNVHGNEPSSSEASMLTIYELLNPSNTKSKNYLQNTVVIIDPCMNPDGRDRYVYWFNQVVGKKANPNPASREHSEPWPGGRSNHYNFDLNRDWAWQTQIESQQRMAKYNEWLPQIHVDFHEQSYNNPYYFAPAAEPFHEVITEWQRNFQTTIGRNNAKYFDENGWLYFTKEQFDLFYPSYGDTYPLYNGAIGMTYEQGGNNRGGLAVVTDAGDTLTLYDRVMHHFTTGISTIEIASQNADKLVKEFHKYYNNAISSPLGDFKSYVIKADDGDKLDRLKKLLNRNKILWSYLQVNNAQLNGLNYFTGKQENFKAAIGDIVVNANQPKSNLLRVLFERVSKLSDSATYDITAWSLPFAYGLETYGLKSYITTTTKANPDSITTFALPPTTYGYVVQWNGMSSAKFLTAVLQKGLKVRYAERSFKIGSEDFDKGSLILTKAGNNTLSQSLEQIIKSAAEQANVRVYAVSSGLVDKGFDFGSDKVHVIKSPRVALLAGKEVTSLNMGEIWHLFDQQLNYPVSLINVSDLQKVAWNSFDVLIIPDGDYDFFNEKNTNDELKNWVKRGGKIIAVQSAVMEMAKADWGIKSKVPDDDKKDDVIKGDYSLLHRYENRDRDVLVNSIPGSIFKVELDNTHPLAFGYPDFYYTLKQDENIYEFMKEGWNVGVLRKDNYIAGFTGSKTKEKLKDGLLFGVQEMGRGKVVYLADNPLFRSFWENGKLLFCNAVFMVD
ncbi:M14 metallopeptidase family protein [Pinibacter soli]|uniref:M14 family metallopeptidase n=1 Tax=Pinibacter soli TaxID=3044211 RepID=A0ABT6RHQ6_9BACT|nr:M14 metallopeptidase family protein [Pinibacter soli]MDI3322107.1 M14 family metallopeptidase [Pinibacter soli]